jgi:uncharacterized protein (TIRG00374 family)
MNRKRSLRTVASLVVTGLATAYIVHAVDFHTLGKVLRGAKPGLLLLALAIIFLTLVPMGWRWQRLLAARGIEERLRWLLRANFVGFAAGQILPTGVGGDAVRIYETSRRHPGRGGPVAATVLLERALGGVATLLLAGIGFVLAIGQGYRIGTYLWVELAFVGGTVVLAVALFSRRARGPLSRLVPLVRVVRVERPLRSVYEGLHAYRDDRALLIGVTLLTVGIQALRVLSIWLTGKAVGVEISPRPYFVLGPLLFLVMLVPFTVNGFAVREAFFVAFLGDLGVDANQAFATGFLFFLVTLVVTIPGVLILGWNGIAGLRAHPPPVAQPSADP